MAWRFALSTRAGANLGELMQPRGVTLRFPLNRNPTVTFTVDPDHPMIAELDKLDRTLLRAYDVLDDGTRVLRFIGQIVGREKEVNEGGGHVTFAAAGPMWRLGHRLFGTYGPATFGTTAVSLLDRGEMARRLINALNDINGESSNIWITTPGAPPQVTDTGIRMGVIEASSNHYVSWRMKRADEAISELAGGLDGFDWYIAPVEPTSDALGVYIGTMNIETVIGGSKPDVIWEYGFGKRSVTQWRDITDANALCNWGFGVPAGWPEVSQLMIQAPAGTTPSMEAHGLHDAAIVANIDGPLLSQLVNEHVTMRREPRRTILFSPIADLAGEDRVPRFAVDYIVGDIVRFRAVEKRRVYDSSLKVTGTTDFRSVDALFRIYGVEVQIDQAGAITTELTLVAEA